MITKQDKQLIELYVDEKYYDRNKLIKYLTMHDMVGNEVFSYCDKRIDDQSSSTYSEWLDDEDGYIPLTVSQFVRRIPFYFYTKDYDHKGLESMGTLHYILSTARLDEENRKYDLEYIYTELEYLFYSLHLPLKRIFSYWINQTGQVSGDTFFKWCHYIHLCERFDKTDYFPERFITAYNEMLETAGLPPIIYEIDEWGLGDAFFRNGTIIEFDGIFPCDSTGTPIMKWIGIKATKTNGIHCSCEKSKRGHLWIDITPSTVIHVLNFFNDKSDEEDCWYQVYSGPQTMKFDHAILKERRKKLGFTQQEVANAVETTVRTYQKWESGETTPDGHFLIRLLNWLDIPDIQNAIEYADI